MTQKKLFVVGDLCADICLGKSPKPIPGEEHELKDLEFSVGGCAATFSIIGQRLGINPLLISAIGDDFATASLKKELSSSRIRCKLVKSKKRNALSVITINKKGERAIQSVTNCLDELKAPEVARKILPGLSKGDIVYFGGFFHLKNIRQGFRKLLISIRKKHALVCFDACFDMAGKWDIKSFLPHIDYLFLNEVELRHLSKGNKSSGSISKSKRMQYLLDQGAGHVVLKRAGKGAIVLGPEKIIFQTKVKKINVENSTGAGDAFNAGFVFGLMKGWPLQDCALAANFIAAKKISGNRKTGNKKAIPGSGPQEVTNFVKKHKV